MIQSFGVLVPHGKVLVHVQVSLYLPGASPGLWSCLAEAGAGSQCEDSIGAMCLPVPPFPSLVKLSIHQPIKQEATNTLL